jgi:glycine hydroxymethyltransferase
VKAYLMADIAHTAGLVAAGLLTSPFAYCDVVTTTTHKTLRGPRGALIFYRRGLKDAIDFAVFPSCQGGPHNSTIAAIAVALGQVATPEFRDYAAAVVRGAATLAEELARIGGAVAGGGTENHIVLFDVAATSGGVVTGGRFERVAELCGISVNKNTLPRDTSALNPSGVRLGTPAMTTRGFGDAEFRVVAALLMECLRLAERVAAVCEGRTIAEFTAACERPEYTGAFADVRGRVAALCEIFPLPV